MQLFNLINRVILHSLTCEPLINTNKVHIYMYRACTSECIMGCGGGGGAAAPPF